MKLILRIWYTNPIMSVNLAKNCLSQKNYYNAIIYYAILVRGASNPREQHSALILLVTFAGSIPLWREERVESMAAVETRRPAFQVQVY